MDIEEIRLQALEYFRCCNEGMGPHTADDWKTVQNVTRFIETGFAPDNLFSVVRGGGGSGGIVGGSGGGGGGGLTN